MTNKALWGTAYHEAAHGVVAYFLGLSIGRRGLSIVPDHQEHTLGTAHILLTLREKPDSAVSGRTELHLHRRAISLLAGDIAERKYNSKRRSGAHQDRIHAVEVLAYLSGSDDILQAWLKLAATEATHLVETYWPLIELVAQELVEKKRLSSRQLKQILWKLPKLGL